MPHKKVYILKTTDINKVALKTLEVLDAINKKEKTDKNILLKPNAVGPYPPSAGVTTSPHIIQALRQNLAQADYKVLVGDCPGESSGTTEEIFAKSEILAASGDAFINLGKEASVIDFPCRTSKKVAIANAVLDADIVISLAKLKTSCFMMFSGAVKNNYGIIPGTQKAQIHNEFPKRDDFADMLIDLANIPKKLLAVIDGSTIMHANGPVHGEVRRENIYIISEDVFAADYAIAQLLGFKIAEVPVLKRAQQRGILNPQDIEIISDISLPLADIKLPITLDAYLQETNAEPDRNVEYISDIKININKEKCICCGHCANICPAQAITMNPYPEIDHEKCIRCYCCNELCSEGAAKPEKDIKKLWDKIMAGESIETN